MYPCSGSYGDPVAKQVDFGRIGHFELLGRELPQDPGERLPEKLPGGIGSVGRRPKVRKLIEKMRQ
jgi:hypothetical protein